MSPLFSQGSQTLSQDDFSMDFSSSQMITDDESGGTSSASGGEADSKKRKRSPIGGGGGLRATVTPQFTGGATGDSGFTFLGGSAGAGNWLELGPTPFSQGGAVGAFGGKPSSGFKAPMRPFKRPGETSTPSSAGPSPMAPPQRRYPSQASVGRAGTPGASYYEQNTPR